MSVPQGSTLSLVLFSHEINNIVRSAIKGSKASLLLDDFALCRRALNMTDEFIEVKKKSLICGRKVQSLHFEELQYSSH